MQTISGQVARMLHEEHTAALSLLQRLSACLSRHGPITPPKNTDHAVARLLSELSSAIETEIRIHFKFEEDSLFPLLDAFGERELMDLYLEEHRVIVSLGDKAAVMARAARTEGFDAPAWASFHSVATAFADRLTGHAEAEEAALLPLLDDLLDMEADERLAETYQAMR